MSERRRNIIIGLFVFLGFAALGILILLFGSFPNVVSTGNYSAAIYFHQEVEDIPVDTDVFMLGKRVGRVSRVEWIGGQIEKDAKTGSVEISGIKASIEIEDSVSIPREAMATFKEAAIGFGRSRVQIKVPLGIRTEFLARDGTAVLEGQIVGSFEQIVPREMGVTLQKAAQEIGNLAEALTPAAKDIHELLKPVTSQQVDAGETIGNVSSTVQRLDNAIKNINDVIGRDEVKQDLAATVGNIRQASEELGSAIVDIKAFAASARTTAQNAESLPQDIKNTVATVQERFDTLARGLIVNSDNLNKMLVGLDKAVGEINKGQGTIGHLVYDNRLYEALTLTAQRLSATIADMQSLVKTWQEQGLRIESMKLR